MNKFFKSLICPGYHRHVWSDYLPAILSILYGKSFGIWCFCRLATGDWDLECGSPCDSHCCQSQIRLVLSSDGSIGFDPRWAWNWDESFICYLNYHLPVNGIGALENYLLVLGWIFGMEIGGLSDTEKVL